jgi:hypothetical protein
MSNRSKARTVPAPRPDGDTHTLVVTADWLGAALADLELAGVNWSYQERAAYLIGRFA